MLFTLQSQNVHPTPSARVGLFLLVILTTATAAADASISNQNCTTLPCTEVINNAAVFKQVENAPYWQAFSNEGTPLGWVGLSTDIVDILGYSSRPLQTLVGVTTAGNISGALVVHHSEPIILVGIKPATFTAFVNRYKGIGADKRIMIGQSKDPNIITIDAISGATVTCLAENRTIVETARAIAVASGVIEAIDHVPGHFAASGTVPTWKELMDEQVMGRLTVNAEEVDPTQPSEAPPFIDLWFTIADSPSIGRALLGNNEYRYAKTQLKAGEHLLVILGQGTSSFKGSGFVRGGIFDRVRLEQGLLTTTFADLDYHNLPSIAAIGAPEFKEGAYFRIHKGRIDPGRSFDLVFLASRYTGKGGFKRDFFTFTGQHRLPASVYALDGPDPEAAAWRRAWEIGAINAILTTLFLLFVASIFVLRRFTTSSMKRLQRLHVATMLGSVLILGYGLHAQPSVTQILTFIDALVHDWRWGLFLSEPVLVVSWVSIVLVTTIWGRGVFCGWACPYGALTELIHKIAHKLHIPQYELPLQWHSKLKYIRYILLLGLVPVFLWSPQWGEKLAEIEPFKTTFFLTPWARPWLFFLWWLFLLVLSIVIWRPFCQYLCPLGAGLAVFGSVRVSGPYRRNFCTKCTICARGCEPRAIRTDGSIDPRDCLSCMECEANYRSDEVCPPLIQIRRKKERAQ